MGQIALQIPQAGLPNSTEDAKIATDLTTIQTVINGNIDSTNVSSSAGITGTQLSASANIAYSQLNNGSWVSASLGSGIGAFHFTPGSRAQVNNAVRLRGGMQNNTGGTFTNGSSIALLDVAARPSQQLWLPAVMTGGSGGTVGTLSILTDGHLQFSLDIPNLWALMLDGIEYTLS